MMASVMHDFPEAEGERTTNQSIEEFSYNGSMNFNYQRPDSRIYEDVISAIVTMPLVDTATIDVLVKDGCVYLKGPVDSRESKKKIEAKVEKINGVVDIFNDLKIWHS